MEKNINSTYYNSFYKTIYILLKKTNNLKLFLKIINFKQEDKINKKKFIICLKNNIALSLYLNNSSEIYYEKFKDIFYNDKNKLKNILYEKYNNTIFGFLYDITHQKVFCDKTYFDNSLEIGLTKNNIFICDFEIEYVVKLLEKINIRLFINQIDINNKKTFNYIDSFKNLYINYDNDKKCYFIKIKNKYIRKKPKTLTRVLYS
jgi:hypothetical protein